MTNQFKFLSSLNEVEWISPDSNDSPICPQQIGDSTVSIVDYNLRIIPQYTGEYRSGRIGNPDNWEPDEHPELDHLDIVTDYVTVKIDQKDHKQFYVSFDGQFNANFVEDAFTILATKGNVNVQPLNLPISFHDQLINLAKNYLLNNKCYDSTIVDKHHI